MTDNYEDRAKLIIVIEWIIFAFTGASIAMLLIERARNVDWTVDQNINDDLSQDVVDEQSMFIASLIGSLVYLGIHALVNMLLTVGVQKKNFCASATWYTLNFICCVISVIIFGGVYLMLGDFAFSENNERAIWLFFIIGGLFFYRIISIRYIIYFTKSFVPATAKKIKK